MDGALMEIGPFRLKDEDTVVSNEGSWHKYANLLFIDQPRGVGLSTGESNSYIESMDDMTEDLLNFMDEYFDIFPEQLDSEFYIAGESFAGQYIPYIGRAILDRNKKLRETKDGNNSERKEKIIDLRGLLIGNGWVDPVQQYLAYLPFSYSKGLLTKGTSEASQVEKLHKECAETLSDLGAENMTAHVDECEEIAKSLINISFAKDNEHCFNIYDIRLKDSFPSCGMNWPPDLEYITPYLRKDEVLKALNSYTNGNGGWRECSGSVHHAMDKDRSRPSIQLVPDLVKEVSITFFSGVEDFICNTMGTDRMLENLEWNEAKGFGNDAKEKEWTLNGETRGSVISARNISSVKFYGASHMVPFDDSEITQFMFNVASGLTTWDDNNNITLTSWNGNKDHEKSKIAQEATLRAYYRSGTVALVIILIILAVFGYFMWKRENRDMYGPRRGFWKSIIGGLSRWKPKGHQRSRSGKGLTTVNEGSYHGLQSPENIILEEEEEYELGERDTNDNTDILSSDEEENSSPEEVVVKRPEDQV